MTIRVGDPAPDFELDGVDGCSGQRGRYRLGDGLGRPQVLVFYPADETPVCTRQLIAYTSGIGELEVLDARVLALSPQSLDSHVEFAANHGGFAFPMLSDSDRAVGSDYGILGLLDLYRRSTVVIDASGEVRFLHRAVGPGLKFLPLDTIVREVEAARA